MMCAFCERRYTEQEIRDSFNSGFTFGMGQGEKLGQKQTVNRVLGIIDNSIEDVEALTTGSEGAVSEERKEGMLLEARAIRACFEALKGGEQGMTKSEATEILKKYIKTFEGGASIYEALKMAVLALRGGEQE